MVSTSRFNNAAPLRRDLLQTYLDNNTAASLYVSDDICGSIVVWQHVAGSLSLGRSLLMAGYRVHQGLHLTIETWVRIRPFGHVPNWDVTAQNPRMCQSWFMDTNTSTCTIYRKSTCTHSPINHHRGTRLYIVWQLTYHLTLCHTCTCRTTVMTDFAVLCTSHVLNIF